MFCLDHDDAPSPQAVGRSAAAAQFEAVAPTFAAWYAWPTAVCSVWPVHSGQRAPPARRGRHPSGARGGDDGRPVDPPAFARALTEQLDRSVLLLRRGHGHTAYTLGNECVDRAVDRYLVDGALPESGTVC